MKRNVEDILYDFNIALEQNDFIEIVDLIKEMKDTNPAFVDLMLNSVYFEDDEDFYEEEYEEED